MQIALTKKLSDAIGVKPLAVDDTVDSLFTWTANLTKVWDNSRTDDMLVLVNNATRFTVAIYEVNPEELGQTGENMKAAIENTLHAMHFNPELVAEYMRLAGDITLSRNTSRQTAAWLTYAGSRCSFYAGRAYNGMENVYDDRVGRKANYDFVNFSKGYDEGFMPYRAMAEALADLTGKEVYKNRTFELLVTLDLDLYKAERRILVPADLPLAQLHQVLQRVFHWDGHHLHDFCIYDGQEQKPLMRLIPFEEDLHFDENAILMTGHTLSEFLPKYNRMVYTYDLGDYWQHEIQLVRVIEDYKEELPYLLEAIGVAPPEDVGGVSGFLNFLEIYKDPDHPDHQQMKNWAGYWSPELSDWERRPQVLHG